jgi:hypothetical protein
MALIPKLGPGTVYFLKLVDSRGKHSFHEYKIGFTENDVAERIRQLKTGNPFRITLVDAVKSEAAHFLERRMHARLAEFNTHLEWFEFTYPALLDDQIRTTKQDAARLDRLARIVEQHRSQPSTDIIIEPDDTIHHLCQRAFEIGRAAAQNRIRSEICQWKLWFMSAGSGGIDGIVSVATAGSSNRFNEKEFKSVYPDLHRQYLTESLTESFKFHVKSPRVTDEEFQFLNKQKKDWKKLFEQTGAHVEQGLPVLMATHDAKQVHAEYLKLADELQLRDWELNEVKLELMAACGPNFGIEGVCQYDRSTELKFNKKRFSEERNDLYQQFQVPTEPEPKFKILNERSYE